MIKGKGKNKNPTKIYLKIFRFQICKKLSDSDTELLKNIHSMTLASLLLIDEKIFTATTPKNVQNDQLYAYPSTKKKDVVTKSCAYN